MLGLLYLFVVVLFPPLDQLGSLRSMSSSSDSLVNKQLSPRYLLFSVFRLYYPTGVHISRKWWSVFPALLYDTQLEWDSSFCFYSGPQELKSALSLPLKHKKSHLREGFLQLHNPLRHLRNMDLNSPLPEKRSRSRYLIRSSCW